MLGPMRPVVPHLAKVLLGVLLALPAAHAADAPGFDLRPAAGVLHRLLPDRAAQIELGTIAPKDGHERFRISDADGHVRVEGSTTSALLFGVNWYLKYVAKLQISPNGDWLGTARVLPLPLRAEPEHRRLHHAVLGLAALAARDRRAGVVGHQRDDRRARHGYRA